MVKQHFSCVTRVNLYAGTRLVCSYLKTLLSVTENLHKYLQSETVDLAKAVEYNGAVCVTLKQMRPDEDAAKLYDTVKTFCAANEIPEPCTRQARQKQKRLDDYIVESRCGAVSDLGDSECLKRNLYLLGMGTSSKFQTRVIEGIPRGSIELNQIYFRMQRICSRNRPDDERQYYQPNM